MGGWVGGSVGDQRKQRVDWITDYFGLSVIIYSQ